MKIVKYPNREDFSQLLVRPVFDSFELQEKVKPIVEAVKNEGDKALKEFSIKFDKANLESLKVTDSEMSNAAKNVSEELKQSILVAKRNITLFHKYQKEEINKIEIAEGISCWRKSVPIEKVGLYIPGGSAPLFSTLLMLGIPAQLAGCNEIVICTPPNEDGSIFPAILFTAKILQINLIYKVGGAQAIAAMAFGTESIPKVSKIFGPGNQFVTSAKQLVNAEGIAIDMPAGPSEVLVIADDSANAKFVAADLLSQMEHGIDSQAILVTTSEVLLESIVNEIEKLKANLPRKEIIEKSLSNSKMILVNGIQTAIELSNYYAPEHLILSVENVEEISEKIINAGSVFLGNYSPESAGDYASGTNHTLPTNGFATAYSGVSLDSFVKKITFQRLTKNGLRNLAPTIETMAKAEELSAHNLAVTIRIKNDN